ncbi:MAG: A24 family peptidase [Planctomycetes bacterium]|nr:A24 family peptidase [Planctomycetota bacterium]
MIPLFVRLAVVFVIGAFLGSLANWAIYALAWRPRRISPWSRLEPGASPRGRLDRMPVLGWFALSREAEVHGRGFWIRPLFLEFGFGIALAALYWWEVARLGLIAGQVNVAVAAPMWPVHLQFFSHTILLCWMLAASFIDIDEKIIPDEITVTGTLIGLILATLAPISLLPYVATRPAPAVVSYVLVGMNGAQAVGPMGDLLWLEPVTAVAPRPWQAARGVLTGWPGLAIGLCCYWLWCFALAPRIWRGRRGAGFALRLIASRVGREFNRPPLRWLLGFGSSGIIVVWALSEYAWVGLLSALIGLVGSGGIVWAVRLIGTAALRREAMGFGDVTLMMMVGTFVGWQAGLIAFFLAPFAGLFIGIAQFVLRRDDVIPYGPFLCLATVAVIVAWAPIWTWAQPMFAMGGLVPAVIVVCLAMLGVMLAIWRMIKLALFGREAE